MFPAIEQLRAGTFKFFGRDRFIADFVQGGEHCGPRFVQVLTRGQLRAHHEHARLGQSPGKPKGARDPFGRDQFFVQSPAWCVAQDLGQHLRGGKVGVGTGSDVVAHINQGVAAHAAQGDDTFAVLRRVECVGGAEHAAGLGQRCKVPRDLGQGVCDLELAGDDERGVVGLVVMLVEGLQARDVHVFNVAARPDDAFAVVVPAVHDRHQLLQQDATGLVFARLHLVAHHGHFAVEVGARNEAVDHHVGLPRQIPIQGFFLGRPAGEIVGAIKRRAAIGAQAAPGKFTPGVARGGRAFENQVFQQVRHARFAVVLMTRTHAVGHVHRGRWLGVVGHQEHLQTIGQAVFGDAFHAAQLGHACG